MNLMTFQILGVLLGGRIGYSILYQWHSLIEDHLQCFEFGKEAWRAMGFHWSCHRNDLV